MIDSDGYRAGIGIILINAHRHLFWARRIKPKNAWQFPQGGLNENETPQEGMYRELHEEVGLTPNDVELLAESKDWISYRLPNNLIRQRSKPLCIGQKQKWFLLRLTTKPEKIRFDATERPEFDRFRWVRYWYPVKQVIPFKRKVYRQALQEFAKAVFPNRKS